MMTRTLGATATPGFAPLRKLGEFAAAYQRHLKDQRDYRLLLSLSEKDLRDMGLTREGVKHEMRQPMRRFPN